MGIGTYRAKRDFDRTPEPKGKAPRKRRKRLMYLIQKHDATRMHHDFRLELDGVLKSWAVPRGPPIEPGAKSLAVQTEDHPLEYGNFEGVIPEGEYGAGPVMLWDRGTWEPDGDPHRGLSQGKLSFLVLGERLRGRWSLVRMNPRGGRNGRRATGKEWLLIKRTDREPAELTWEQPERSIVSGRTLEEIAGGKKRRNAGSGSELSKAFESASGARRRPMPARLTPQLATLVDEPPEGDTWLHEIKYDGYRLLAFKKAGKVRLLTRSGQNWTERFPRIASAIAALPVEDAILDGEAVVLKADGSPDFQALQSSFGRRDVQHVFFAFDLPYLSGHDLGDVPLVERKALLERVVSAADATDGALRYGDHVLGKGAAFHREACRHGLEGILSKRADSRYTPGRTRTWLKIKCSQRQDFIVVGWSDPSGSRKHFGSLVLAYRDENGKLTACGRVGSGFSGKSLATLSSLLRRLRVDKPPVQNPPRGAEARDVHWVRPELVVEVSFNEWTSDGKLRQPTFLGLREDRPAKISREEPMEVEVAEEGAAEEVLEESTPATKKEASSIAGVRLSNPDRILYPDSGLTKRALASYYAAIADHVLPHVVDRPLTLYRCPRGREKKCFYQKHLGEGLGAPVRGIDVGEDGKTELYVGIDDLAGLITLVQLGTLELHPWGSRGDKLDRPDRIIFDIDPGEGIAWEEVVATARVLGERLESLGLSSFVRTTGGKGLHVVVPIARRSTWQEVKSFSHDMARAFVRAAPKKYLTTASKAQRKGRIFLDYLRNDRGSTAIASYSTRALPGAPVAMPLRWRELSPRLDPMRYTVLTVPRLLSRQRADPWEGFFDVIQSLTADMRRAAHRAR